MFLDNTNFEKEKEKEEEKKEEKLPELRRRINYDETIRAIINSRKNHERKRYKL